MAEGDLQEHNLWIVECPIKEAEKAIALYKQMGYPLIMDTPLARIDTKAKKINYDSKIRLLVFRRKWKEKPGGKK